MKENYKINFTVAGSAAHSTITAPGGAKLIDVIRDSGYAIQADCGGFGTCGKCKVLVNGESRLACETILDRDMNMELPSGDVSDYIFENPRNTAHVATNTHLPHNGQPDNKLAIAIDLGTTTIAVKLIDISTGKDLIVVSETNAQRPYGSDVISRINMSMDDPSTLKTIIQKQLDRMISRAVDDCNASAKQVARVVIAGNTTMSYVLAGLPCRSLGLAPFEPAYQLKDAYSYNELFGANTLNAPVYIMPFISAYIGGDITAGILTLIQSLNADDSFMLVDMGTNGEIAYCAGGKILCTSAAAGPAFEGGNISCGTGSVKGAISKLSMESCCVSDGDNGNDKRFACETIGATPACGICGSGLLDAMACFIREGIMDASGALNQDSPYVTEEGVTIAEGVTLTQKDVREFQLAKSAIRAGVEVLIGEFGGKPPEKYYIAGGFGQNLDPESAVTTGLLPQSAKGNVIAIGNSSLAGATLCAKDISNMGNTLHVATISNADDTTNVVAISEMSDTLCTETIPDTAPSLCAAITPNADTAHRIAEHGTEINLASHERFNNLFMEHMMF